MLRRAVVALAIAGAWLLTPASVYSDADTESALDAAYFPRLHDPVLHELAHQRAAFQVAYSGGVCDGNGSLTHDGLTHSEVLLCDWDGEVVGQWMASPGHHAILSNPVLTRIGCGSAAGLNGAVFHACLLAGDSPPPQEPVPAPPAEVPPPIESGPEQGNGSPEPSSPGPAGAGEGPGLTPVLLPNTATESHD